MPAEDEFRESQEQQQQEGNQEVQSTTLDAETNLDEPAWKKTKGRGLFTLDGGDVSHYDKATKDAISLQAEQAKKIGVDKPKSNPNVGKFPAPIKSVAVDSPLGDWSLNTPPIFGPYPNMDAKSGFTQPEIYPSDVSKKNIDYDNLRENGKTTLQKLEQRKQDYNKYEDYAGKQFTHLLDYFSAQKGLGAARPVTTETFENGEVVSVDIRNIYLGSFIKTFDDNEDPTMLGYDIIIKWNDSPLFNGTIDTFINKMADLGNSEIASRIILLNRFKEQLVRFLKVDAVITGSSPEFLDGQPKRGSTGVKTYYLRKISGLGGLMNTWDGNEGKQFADYGKDFITLGFNEDVSQNLGNLASLYNGLVYSRLNGRQLIPENLLRFDVDIEITEIRKYNRIFKEDSELYIYPDKIAKYTYTLFECQFFFSSMPHGDTLDMSAPVPVDEYSIKFNYKWSFMKFTKFAWFSNFTPNVAGQTGSTPPGERWKTIEDPIDNRNSILTEIKSSSTNNNAVSGTGESSGQIVSAPATETPPLASKVDETGRTIVPTPEDDGELEAVKKADEISKVAEPVPTSLISDTTNKEVLPITGGVGNIKELVSTSSIQNALGASQLPLPASIKQQVASRFGQVSSILSNPTFKGFNLGMLGGQIQKATGGIGNLQGAISGFTKGNILQRFNEVKSAAVFPSLKGFNLGMLGGEIAKSAGGLLGNLGGVKDSILSRFNDVKSAAIAPFAKGFNLNMLGGEISKASGGLLGGAAGGLLGNLSGVKGDILSRFNDVKSAAIAPFAKGFNLNMIGGAITKGAGGLLGSLGGSVKGDILSRFNDVKSAAIAPFAKGFNLNMIGGAITKGAGGLLGNLGGVKDTILGRLNDVKSSAIAPFAKGFNLNMLGGEIAKGAGGLLGNLGGVKDTILGRLNDVKSSAIAPFAKGFNLNILGGEIAKSAGSLLGNLGGVKDTILGRLNDVKSSAIAPFAKGFNLNILGGEIKKTAGSLLGNLGGIKDNIIGRLNDVKSAAIIPSLKGFNLGMLGGKIAKASGSLLGSLNPVKGDILGRLGEVAKTVINTPVKGFNLGMLGGQLTAVAGSFLQNGAAAAKGLVKDNFEKLKQSVIETGTAKINNTLISQASLLNKTLSNITQVKIPSNPLTKQLQMKATEQAQKFVGNSVKSFFSRK